MKRKSTAEMGCDTAIGGFFELELNTFNDFPNNAGILVNSGRNALECILMQKNVKRLFIPFYCCDAVLDPVKRLGVDYRFYHIDSKLRANISKTEADDWVLLVNYFGILNHRFERSEYDGFPYILDNCQAFFAPEIPGICSFSSPRKFFGVPDGGVISNTVDCRPADLLKPDKSFRRCTHLLQRIDEGPEPAFPEYRMMEAEFSAMAVAAMSDLTRKILNGIDYQAVIGKRNDNFSYLHRHLRGNNRLTDVIEEEEPYGPMVYPFLQDGNEPLREYLRNKRIFTARFWPNIPQWVADPECFESVLFENLIPLPIDQRYGIKEMDRILDAVTAFRGANAC